MTVHRRVDAHIAPEPATPVRSVVSIRGTLVATRRQVTMPGIRLNDPVGRRFRARELV